MKLRAILKENAVLTFRDLNSFQVSMLRKLSDGNMDYDSLSQKEWSVLDGLQDLGLVDDSHNLTQIGTRAAELGKKYGSTDLRRGRKMDNKLGRTGGPAHSYSRGNGLDDELEGEVEPGEFHDQWGGVRERDD